LAEGFLSREEHRPVGHTVTELWEIVLSVSFYSPSSASVPSLAFRWYFILGLSLSVNKQLR